MTEHLGNASFKNGSVKISNDIITLIAAMAALEVEDVVSLNGTTEAELEEKIKKQSVKGIAIEFKEGQIKVDLHLILAFQAKIPEVARKVQENVVKQIDVMTGLTVTEVNVVVEGLDR